MNPVVLLEDKRFSIAVDRLCYELIENHSRFSNSVLIGLQPRGIYLAKNLYQRLLELQPDSVIQYGNLDATFYRDDFRRREMPIIPQPQEMNFVVEGKKVILVDDVLFTGRTVRSALDALVDFGRPEKVELLVLVDRRYSRHLPIEPDYVGITVDTRSSQRVKVDWQETDGANKVMLIN
ncbi:MAG: bifunctional pyr operon transcriptional regulator/uracil phosphoribosyltransferase PyrR [Bacteroidia bacterium]